MIFWFDTSINSVGRRLECSQIIEQNWTTDSWDTICFIIIGVRLIDHPVDALSTVGHHSSVSFVIGHLCQYHCYTYVVNILMMTTLPFLSDQYFEPCPVNNGICQRDIFPDWTSMKLVGSTMTSYAFGDGFAKGIECDKCWQQPLSVCFSTGTDIKGSLAPKHTDDSLVDFIKSTMAFLRPHSKIREKWMFGRGRCLRHL
jgi:hypothetical protein